MPNRKHLAALRHMVSGDEASGRQQVQTFLETLRTSPSAGRLWWAKRGRRILASALMVDSPGKVGFLHHNSVWAENHDRGALVELLRAICAESLAAGDALVQTMVPSHLRENIPILLDAGFEKLAELLSMRHDLGDVPEVPADARWTFRALGDFTESELMEIISMTYDGSLDCPRLSGVRRTEDVLASHRATGVFTPEGWWLAERDGRTGGCILVNRSAHGCSAEIVYMGVAPEFRGQRLGELLLIRAADDAAKAGRDALMLMVDAGNAYATRLYERFGFRRTQQRSCYVRFGEPSMSSL